MQENDILLIMGLGNYGNQYARTKHNAGFDVVEILAHHCKIPLGRRRCRAIIGEGQVEGRRAVILQPQTYMNDSGISAKEALHYYKADVKNLLVVYDDIDLSLGSLRIRGEGSAGTHNGMRSILYHIGRQDFPRVRVGIDKPPAGWELSRYVLSKYNTPEERALAFETYQKAAMAIETFAKEGLESAMRQYNQTKKKTEDA